MGSRLERVIQLLLLLQSGMPYNTLQLAQELGVHRRTIFRDIALLRSLGVSIEHDVETARYSLKGEVRFETQELTVDEVTELLVAACFTMLPGGRTARLARQAAMKLSRRIPKENRRELSRIIGALPPHPSDLGSTLPSTFDAILAAIRKRRVLQVIAATETGRVQSIAVAPLSLSFSAAEWALYGYIAPAGPFTTIGLSSITTVSETAVPFTPRRMGPGRFHVEVDPAAAEHRLKHV